MKLTSVILTLLTANLALADSFYAVSENQSDFPLPYQLPMVGKNSAKDFEWQRYFSEARSKADLAYRQHVAKWDYAQPTAGGGDSTAEQMLRANLAGEEFKLQCLALIKKYRSKLKDHTDALVDLNEFISASEQAITLQIKIVGESWGGSGAKQAYASARMYGYLNFYRNLKELGKSLYFQDLPD
ncbi:MAG: hypothetical protein AAF571_10945 [Verrucomicrobiota bacterium]